MSGSVNAWTGRWRNRIALAGLLFVVAMSGAVSFSQALGVYDEGFALTSAWRLLQGEVPHRDYWAAYPPGTSLALAATFAVIGPSLEASRILHVTWSTVLLVSMFGLLKEMASRTRAALACTVAALWTSASFPASYAMLPALAISLAALWLYVAALRTNSNGRMVTAGALAGTVVLFRHDVFGYLFVSIALTLALDFSIRRRTTWAPPHAGTTRFLVAMGVVGAMLLIALLWVVGWRSFLDQAIVFPATGMRENRLLPVPDWWSPSPIIDWLLAWSSPISTVLILACSARLLWKGDPMRRSLLLILAIFCALLTLQSHNRLDLTHAAPSMLVVLVLLAITSFREPDGQWRPLSRLAAATVAALVALPTLLSVLPWIDLQSVARCLAGQHRTTCPPTPAAQDEVLSFLERHVPAGEPVFVANARHDKVFVNDASLYFRLRRPVPVKWHEMHPGVITTAAVQSEIVASLTARPVRYVVIAQMPESTEPNASAQSSGITLLDEYLASHFSTIYQVGRYSVRQRHSP